MPKELTTNEFDRITKVSQIPGFPFKTHFELKYAVENKEITIGAARDLARQWVMSAKSSPRSKRTIVYIYASAVFVLPVLFIVYSLISFQFALILFIIPYSIAFFLLNPSMLRMAPIFRVLIWLGFVFVFMGGVGVWGLWALYLGLSIITPWFLGKEIYNTSVNTAIAVGYDSESKFVELFKYGILAIHYPDGKMVWFTDLVKPVRSRKENSPSPDDELKDWDTINKKG